MSNKVTKIPVNSCNMTVPELCDFVKENPPECLIVLGSGPNGLYFKASNRLNRGECLFHLELAKLHVLDLLDDE